MENSYPSLREDIFAYEFNRRRQKEKAEQTKTILELKKEVEKRVLAIKEVREKNRFFARKLPFLRKIRTEKILNRFAKDKKSDNLASQVVLSNVEYYVQAAAAVGGRAAAAVGQVAGRAAAAGSQAAGRVAQVGAQAGARGAGALGEQAAGNLGKNLGQKTGQGMLDDLTGGKGMGGIEDQILDQMGIKNKFLRKILGNQIKGLMQGTPQPMEMIKKGGPLMYVKIILTATILFSFVNFFIWILQAAMVYAAGTENKWFKKFYWLDFALMGPSTIFTLIILFLFFAASLILGIACQLDIFGLVC